MENQELIKQVTEKAEKWLKNNIKNYKKKFLVIFFNFFKKSVDMEYKPVL